MYQILNGWQAVGILILSEIIEVRVPAEVVQVILIGGIKVCFLMILTTQ
jgi:hypothetical protein